MNHDKQVIHLQFLILLENLSVRIWHVYRVGFHAQFVPRVASYRVLYLLQSKRAEAIKERYRCLPGDSLGVSFDDMNGTRSRWIVSGLVAQVLEQIRCNFFRTTLLTKLRHLP